MSQPPVRENRPRNAPQPPAGASMPPAPDAEFAGGFSARPVNRRREVPTDPLPFPAPAAAPVADDPAVTPEITNSRLGLSTEHRHRLRQVGGLALLLFGLYLLVSMAAHFVVGAEDQSVAGIGAFPERNLDGQAANSGGTWGAWLAENLISNGYGFIALLIPLYISFAGLALLEAKYRARARRWWLHLLFWLHWTSFTLGTWTIILHLESLAWGGAVGTTLTDWTRAYFGLTGSVLLSLFAICAYGVAVFRLTLEPSKLAATAVDAQGDFRAWWNRLLRRTQPDAHADEFADPAHQGDGLDDSGSSDDPQPDALGAPAWAGFDLPGLDLPGLAPLTGDPAAIVPQLMADPIPVPAKGKPKGNPNPELEIVVHTPLPDRDLSALRLAHEELNGWPAAPMPGTKPPTDKTRRGHVPAHEAQDENEPDPSVLEALRKAPIPIPPAAHLGEPELIVEIPPSEPEVAITPILSQDNIQAVDAAGARFEKIVSDEDLPTIDGDEDVAQEERFEAYDPTRDLSHYQYPTLDLLKAYERSNTLEVDRTELEANKQRILTTLANFNIEITSIKATVGPTVTLYEIVPAPGIRISKIKVLEDDIALNLAAPGIRIIAPMPGKGTIGIEIPNSKPETVSFRSLVSTEKFRNTDAILPIAIGKTISNEVFIADLAKMPHLLVAGATGQGKSVGLNCILASLLYKKHPSQVKFVLIDPKKVEMTLFQVLRQHFLAKLPNYEDAIITDTRQAVHVLSSLCAEMDQRYDLLKLAGVRNIVEYNAKFTARRLNPQRGHRYLPYLVLVVDELADLMMTAGKEVEAPIIRLAQLGRAAGLHLIIATQRPSVNVITGIIKANFPARLSYRVISKVDSRTILDSNGAEQLVGRGDALLSTGTDLLRIQNAFVDTPEIEALVQFIGKQQGYAEPYLLPEVATDEGDNLDSGDDMDSGEIDPLFDEAARLIVRSQQGSTSLIQRKMAIGYNRAGRLMDQLERTGICGAASGSKPREVLIQDEASLEMILARMRSMR